MTKSRAQSVSTAQAMPAEPAAEPQRDERDTRWSACCKVVISLLRDKELDAFMNDLSAGRCPDFDTQLMTAAAALVAAVNESDVHVRDWPPAPTDAELADIAAWVSRRIEQARVDDRVKGWKKRLAAAQGQRPSGNGSGKPNYLQQSKLSLDQAAQRLVWTMTQHQETHGGFERKWLDHRSPFYISVKRGGISNKQITIMACQIAGQQQRPFDDSWNIVTKYLAELRTATSSEPGEAT